MDGGNRWHVASFHGAHDKTIINSMMLRFRPIAPKPDTGSSFPEGVSPENKDGLLTNKRVKRKYVRVRRHRNISKRRNNNNRSISFAQDKKVGLGSATETLQLMPEKTDGKDVLPSGSTAVNTPIQDYRNRPTWINNNVKNMSVEIEDIGTQTDRTVAVPSPVEAVESWVTVEFVTDTCMDVGVLGCTDVERINNLEKDTCPGFISDGLNIVQWVNDAYKRMVRHQGEGRSPETTVTVRLVTTKAKLPSTTAFSCMVRSQYSGQKDKCTKMVPCDVWRMDHGGFAWRLDVKAALSLGLS
ncbi:hypothetical protein FNV43_RR14179 [Rhamnella rubrinervis]|uniref:DUF7950 domain-containing protein n=1 Tax=Rhamnella rubrinervis TaxID=2594499 RepID=A0A8K0MG34_9ROSA|nr:hypothetical protein FNV43_RR14179 [Rhamnella rubrinervis]